MDNRFVEGESWPVTQIRARDQFEAAHFLKGSHRSTIAFSLEIEELGITAPEFKQLFVSSLLSNLTVI
jgi:hypothetical protein